VALHRGDELTTSGPTPERRGQIDAATKDYADALKGVKAKVAEKKKSEPATTGAKEPAKS